MCISEERELRMKRLRRNLLSRHLCQVYFQLLTHPKVGDSQITFALTQKNLSVLTQLAGARGQVLMLDRNANNANNNNSTKSFDENGGTSQSLQNGGEGCLIETLEVVLNRLHLSH